MRKRQKLLWVNEDFSTFVFQLQDQLTKEKGLSRKISTADTTKEIYENFIKKKDKRLFI